MLHIIVKGYSHLCAWHKLGSVESTWFQLFVLFDETFKQMCPLVIGIVVLSLVNKSKHNTTQVLALQVIYRQIIGTRHLSFIHA